MNISRSMSGSPWHTEKMVRAEGDNKRHKSRCKYYDYVGGSNHCTIWNGQCKGSAHCMEYDALSEKEFRKRQGQKHPNKKKHDDYDEPFWF